MRIPLIAANWKMHKNQQEVGDFITEFTGDALPEDREVLIAPSFTSLPALTDAAADTKILIAAQNMHYEESGAFTGEVSAPQLRDVGCTHVILGHSERRHIFGEDNELLHMKLVAAQKYDLVPIYCVGEMLEERKRGDAQDVVYLQLKESLRDLEPNFLQKIVIAYEPVWAIGTGETATPEQAEEMHAFIREHIPESTRILYGGSVKPENAEELINQPSIDGFLIGGASLEVESFSKIVSVEITIR